ncbi:MAG: 5,10-methylenetetrahydromethanopterin reductase [Methanonatronarchaeales archaeon]|nr:5,10-methylenetetrahydromethanopterin reductase [Methanonatronarchaeales archaeon]
MKFGVEFVPDTEVRKVTEKVLAAEESGFDFLWITDHYNNRNVYLTLGDAAQHTSEVTLGPGVTNPYLVHPAETASAAATLDELSGGRAVLGIGAGDRSTLAKLGYGWEKPLTRTREAVSVMRRLLNGETVDFEGEFFELSGASLNMEPGDVPIYVGAQGPNMMRMAGRYGDGVLMNASHRRDFEYAVPLIEEGAEESGKSLSDLDVVAYASVSVANDEEAAREAARPVVAFIVAGSPPVVYDRHGIDPEDAERVAGGIGSGDFGAAFGAVTREMLDAFAIYGTPSECADRIAELRKLGVTQVVAGSPIGPDKVEAMNLIGEEVKPSP